MSIELLELAESALGDLANEVVFVGGATVGLWISDRAAPPVRPTEDIDMVVEAVTRGEFYDFEAKLRRAGFREDRESGVICRWRYPASELVVDAMPSRPDIFGFENQWQIAAIPHAVTWQLPSGAAIRVTSPVYLLAMKLEAFKSRGNNDFLASRDFTDIVTLIDGRPELTSEVESAETDVRHYISAEAQRLLSAPRLPDGLAGAVRPDSASQERIDLVVMPTITKLAGGQV